MEFDDANELLPIGTTHHYNSQLHSEKQEPLLFQNLRDVFPRLSFDDHLMKETVMGLMKSCGNFTHSSMLGWSVTKISTRNYDAIRLLLDLLQKDDRVMNVLLGLDAQDLKTIDIDKHLEENITKEVILQLVSFLSAQPKFANYLDYITNEKSRKIVTQYLQDRRHKRPREENAEDEEGEPHKRQREDDEDKEEKEELEQLEKQLEEQETEHRRELEEVRQRYEEELANATKRFEAELEAQQEKYRNTMIKLDLMHSLQAVLQPSAHHDNIFVVTGGQATYKYTWELVDGETVGEMVKKSYLQITFNLDKNDYLYLDFVLVKDYVIQRGDILEYDILIEEGNKISFDFATEGQHNLAQAKATDQNGLSAHPREVIDSANGKWYSRKIEIPQSLVGQTIVHYDIGCEAGQGTQTTARFRNIRITNNGNVNKRIYPMLDEEMV